MLTKRRRCVPGVSVSGVASVRPFTASVHFPDAPSIGESGFPGFEAAVWYGVVGPAGLPPAVVARVHAEVQKALAAG